MFRRSNFRQAKDEDLVAALQKGRLKALEELYLRYEENMRRYFYRMTGQDAELARDLCQDLFVKVAEKAGDFQVHRRFRTWLYSLAHNMCKNHYRHQSVVSRVHNDLLLEEAPLPAAPIIAGIDEDIFRERIDAALAGMDADRRSAFLLRHREELSLREIADIQACPLGTVKSRLHYAHQFLAKQLADLKPEIIPEDEQLRR